MVLEDFRLRVFVTVAGLGSFTAAARKLGISQPAVSQNVAELERAVGEPLFARSRGEVSLTDKGRLLKAYADKILFWYARADAVLISKTEAPAQPTLLSLDGSRRAEVSVVDGELCVKLL